MYGIILFFSFEGNCTTNIRDDLAAATFGDVSCYSPAENESTNTTCPDPSGKLVKLSDFNCSVHVWSCSSVASIKLW